MHNESQNPFSVSPASMSTAQALPAMSSQRRPIPVWIISAFCVLQMGGVLLAIKNSHYIETVRAGEVSLFSAVFGFLYPTLLLIAGVFLFFMRRAALPLFVVYVIWGVLKLAGGTSLSLVASLSVMSCVVGYCWWLKVTGKLR